MLKLIIVKPWHLKEKGRDDGEETNKFPQRHNDNLKLPLRSGLVLVLLWACHLLIGLTGKFLLGV